MHHTPPVLLLTAGEPAGIGPELCLKIASRVWPASLAVCADRALLEQTNARMGYGIEILDWDGKQPLTAHRAGELHCLHTPVSTPVIAGQLNPENARYVLETLRIAANLVQAQVVDAIITAPVHKGVINDAGIPFTGHTEFFANHANADPIMMLACPSFRVALATTHLPLRSVADAITPVGLEKLIRLLNNELRTKYGLESPVIHVCGLNPHAGEGGHLGLEEIEVIRPVIERLGQEGLNLTGPLPADTALTPAGMTGADVTLAMYHDQGLPVLKYAGFGKAVNVTLGLPFIRVSVDHGTALDLAGKDKADAGSLETAINEALMMIRASAGSQNQ